jgi:hypothetical protein
MRKRSGTSSRSQTGSKSDRALDLGCGHGFTLDGGKFVTQLRHALLELVVALVELSQALGRHVAAGFVATDGLQHVPHFLVVWPPAHLTRSMVLKSHGQAASGYHLG